MKSQKICFAASSGGHYEQLMNLAPLMNEYSSFIVTEETSGTKMDKQTGVQRRVYYLSLINRRDKAFLKILFHNTKISIQVLKKERPDVIITTGVLSVVPLCLLGKYFFHARLLYIESYAKTTTPTLTGKIMYHFADHFLVQWPGMLKVFPKAVYKGGLY